MYRSMVPFIETDYKALRKHFHVQTLQVTKNVLRDAVGFVSTTPKSDVIFVWFAGFQALLSVLFGKLFRKKIIVVAGGYDAAYVPEINYGAFMTWYRGAVAYFVFRNSDAVIAVSYSTRNETLRRVTPKSTAVIYNAVDTDLFIPNGKKQHVVLTVGAVNESNIQKKGLMTFVKTAAYLPNVPFILVGKHTAAANKLKAIASQNIQFTGYLSIERLIRLYQNAKVYAQLSYHESFGVSLAEAMSCQCIPVATRRTALPEVVGVTGFYVEYGDAQETAKAIETALAAEDSGKAARERVIEMFTIEKREKELVKLILATSKNS